MSTVNAEDVRSSLKQCMDPEVPLSIVDMGLIYGINVNENNDCLLYTSDAADE